MRKIISLVMCCILMLSMIGSLCYDDARSTATNTAGLSIITDVVPDAVTEHALRKFSGQLLFQDALDQYGISRSELPTLRLGAGFKITDPKEPAQVYSFPIINSSNQVVFSAMVIEYDGHLNYQTGVFEITKALQNASSVGTAFEVIRTDFGFAGLTAEGAVIPLYAFKTDIEEFGLDIANEKIIAETNLLLSNGLYSSNAQQKVTVQISTSNLVSDSASLVHADDVQRMGMDPRFVVPFNISDIRFISNINKMGLTNENGTITEVSGGTCWAASMVTLLGKYGYISINSPAK